MTPSKTSKNNYAIAPAPESVARLGQLVSKRLEEMDTIVKVIEGDSAFKARLLLVANRGDPDGPIDSVEGAIMRTGIESVLVVAMLDPLTRAVVQTFSTMLNLKLEAASRPDSQTVPCIVSSAEFTGHATGTVHLRMGEALARNAAAIILGEEPGDLSMETVSDVVGEFTNMVAGNLSSNLSDASLNCRLSTPTVQNLESFTLPKAAPGRQHELFFVNEGHTLSVAVTIHSMNE